MFHKGKIGRLTRNILIGDEEVSVYVSCIYIYIYIRNQQVTDIILRCDIIIYYGLIRYNYEGECAINGALMTSRWAD